MSTTGSLWLKAAAERSLARRHPWVFSGAVTRVEGNPQPGDTVGWAGTTYTVRDVVELAPDGVVIAAHVIVSV